MSFIDCIALHVKDKQLKQSQADALIKKFDDLVVRYSETMGDSVAATKAAQDIVAVEEKILITKRINEIRAVKAQKAIVDELNAKPGKFSSNVQELYERTKLRQDTVLKQHLRYMDDFVDKFASKRAGLVQDVKGVLPIYRELYGETTGDLMASAIAKGVRKSFDVALKRFKTHGGIIGKLENYTPQVHDFRLIKQVDFNTWQSSLIAKLDRSKMIDWDTGLPFTDIRLSQVMKDDFEDIISNGRAGLLQELESGKQKTLSRHGTDISERRQAGRFYIFKDADSFFEYNNQFGAGDEGLFEMIISYHKGMARDTAMLEKLGPKPNAISTHLTEIVKTKEGQIATQLTSGMFDVLSGKIDTTVGDSKWFSALSHLQNLQRSSMLGSAPIAALSDTTFLIATARLNKLPVMDTIGRYLSLLTFGAGDREIARSAGYILEDANGRLMKDIRFTETSMVGGFSSMMANVTNRLSGLHHMTNAVKHTISLEAEAALARSKNIPFDKLDRDFREFLLERNGITAQDWAVIQKSPVTEMDQGANFLRADNVLQAKGVDAKTRLEVANKIDDMVFRLRDLVSNEPSLKARAITTGAGIIGGEAARIGTIPRAFFSSIAMFKTFPITVMFNHLIPAVGLARSRPEYLMSVAVGTTAFGALAIQLSEIVKGKQPKSTEDFKFWQAAALKGGGLGLFGDFLFQDRSRYGRSITSEFMGPVFGFGDDALKTFKGNFDKATQGKKTSFKRDLFRMVKRNIPLQNLWYSRLAMDRLFFDQIERTIDVDYDDRVKRAQKRMLKDSDQLFWWAPGETAPSI